MDVEELEDELERVLSASPRNAAAGAEVLERAVAACRDDALASDWFDLPTLLDELAEVYQELGRVDDALEAMRAALEAGYDSQPDPRCRLAEIMLRAGRREPAAAIYAQVKAETPDGVWLYNCARLAASRYSRTARSRSSSGYFFRAGLGHPEHPTQASWTGSLSEAITAIASKRLVRKSAGDGRTRPPAGPGSWRSRGRANC